MRANPKRVVFAEGEEEAVIRAAAAFQNSGLGKALLIGREDVVKAGIAQAGIEDYGLEIRVPHSAKEATPYIDAALQTHCSGAALSIAIACAW